MKKVMVLVGLLAALFMVSAAMAGDFTIQVVAGTCTEFTSEPSYTFDVIVTNGTDYDLTNVKVQGGTSAWAQIIEEGACTSEACLLPEPMNPKKSKKGQNKNCIACFYPVDLVAGASQTFTISVMGEPKKYDPADCADCNVSGNWAASGEYTVDDVTMGISAMGLNPDGSNFTIEVEPGVYVQQYQTPELTLCEFE